MVNEVGKKGISQCAVSLFLNSLNVVGTVNLERKVRCVLLNSCEQIPEREKQNETRRVSNKLPRLYLCLVALDRGATFLQWLM